MIEDFVTEPDNEEAVRTLFEGVSTQLKQRIEARRLEEMTGIDLSTFTGERFDMVIGLLAKISDPSQKLQ